jgi:hypothetical protein
MISIASRALNSDFWGDLFLLIEWDEHLEADILKHQIISYLSKLLLIVHTLMRPFVHKHHACSFCCSPSTFRELC